MSYGEIIIYINAFNERKEIELKQTASNVYILADLIGSSVSRLFGKGNKMPEIKKVYPSLFQTKQDNEPEDWRIMKEKLLDFTEHHNNKKGGGND